MSASRVLSTIAASVVATSALALVGSSTAQAADSGSGVIRGTVLETGYVIAPGIDVWLYSASTGEFVADTVTESSQGAFEFTGLKAGSYTLRFENQNQAIEEWYDNRPNQDTATAIPLSAGGVVVANAYLSEVAENLVKPTVSGTAAIGSTLTAGRGTWFPAEHLEFQYQWLRNGSAIDGANASTYLVRAADAGHMLSVRVIAVRQGHTEAATSASTATVPGVVPTPEPTTTPTTEPTTTPTTEPTTSPTTEPTTSPTTTPPVVVAPVNNSLPVISGTRRVGATLTTTPGWWSPSGTHTFRWTRNGRTIAGATAKTYRLVPADGGTRVGVVVTATNSAGAASAAAVTSSVSKATTKLSASAVSKKKARLTVTTKVISAGARTGRVTITVKVGKKSKSKVVTVRKGVATTTFTGLKRGKATVRVTYSGDSSTSSAKATRTAKVR